MTAGNESLPLQAYRAYYENGRVITVGNPTIPEGSALIVTVVEMPTKSRSQKQLEALERFWEESENTPPLPPEFDEIISQRVNITRETNYMKSTGS